MKAWAMFISAYVAWGLMSAVACAGSRSEKGGISVSLHATKDQLTVCVGAREGWKVSSEYGVQFNADRQAARAFSDKLPYTYRGEGTYFQIPLRIDLKTNRAPRGRILNVDLGACAFDAQCQPLVFELEIPGISAETSGAPACS